MKKLSLTLLALLAGLQAHAGTQTINISYSDLQFHVIDFNQWDDMEPSYEINFAGGHWNNRMQINDGGTTIINSTYTSRPASFTYAPGGAQGSKQASISVTDNSMQLHASHSSSNTMGIFASQIMNYTLGPGSMLEVTGRLHISSSDPNSYATTSAYFTNSIDFGNVRLDREFYGPNSYSENFTLQAINYDWEPSYGTLEIWMWGAAAGIPPAVPEPETWAMLGTGLAGLGMMARRRRQAAQTTQ